MKDKIMFTKFIVFICSIALAFIICVEAITNRAINTNNETKNEIYNEQTEVNNEK